MNSKKYLVWHKIYERMGNSVKVDEDTVTMELFHIDESTHEEVASLEHVKMFEYSDVTDIEGTRLAEDAMVEIKDLKDASMGIVVKSNYENWFILLYELIGNQYSPENGKTIPLTDEMVEKHQIKTNGHLELFAKHMRENTQG